VVLSHKRRTKLLSSVPFAYSGSFFITSGILLASSILYIVFLPGIALGQEWIQYTSWGVFKISYPDFLRAYEFPDGVTLIPESEIGSEYLSFRYTAYATPYNGLSRTSDELASEITSQIVQAIPNAQFTYVGPNPNNAGIAAVIEYTHDDFRAAIAAIIFNGKLFMYGYDFAMGPNESQYIYLGNSITSSLVPIPPASNVGGLEPTQPNGGDFPATRAQLDSFTQWNKGIGERNSKEYGEYLHDANTPGTGVYCSNNQNDDKCP
jgi:hypothetical protein